MFITGFPQKYNYLDISQWIINRFGDIENLRFIHHLTGLTFIAFFMIHVIINYIGLIIYKWHPTMTVSKKDFRDLVIDLKYFLGINNIPAKCDRYNYKQKFQYWSVFISTLIMILSGLIMLCPIFFTQFLPGLIIPLAKLIHTNQFVVFYIIALWHLYDNIFSPNSAPIDTSIFTGYITKEKLLKEHPLDRGHKKI
jgi:cytochrome b subunit of formate dehydrogenase